MSDYVPFKPIVHGKRNDNQETSKIYIWSGCEKWFCHNGADFVDIRSTPDFNEDFYDSFMIVNTDMTHGLQMRKDGKVKIYIRKDVTSLELFRYSQFQPHIIHGSILIQSKEIVNFLASKQKRQEENMEKRLSDMEKQITCLIRYISTGKLYPDV